MKKKRKFNSWSKFYVKPKVKQQTKKQKIKHIHISRISINDFDANFNINQTIDKWTPFQNAARNLPYDLFLKTLYWRKVRTIVLKRDLKKCKKCHSKDKLVVHHTTYENHFNEHNHLSDLITLCEKCHNKLHKKIK